MKKFYEKKESRVGFHRFLILIPIFSLFLFLLPTQCANLYASKIIEYRSTEVQLLPDSRKPKVTFFVKVAETNEQQRRGLMFTRHLPDHHGMLFVFNSDMPRQFWMKNTQIPLDILFFDAKGYLVNLIASAKPYSLTPLHSQGSVRYVLEINGGRAAEIGVQSEARLLLPILIEP